MSGDVEHGESARDVPTLNSALLAVYARAILGPAATLPDVETVRLRAAAEVLRDHADGESVGESRRRRVLGELVGAPAPDRELDQAVDILLRPGERDVIAALGSPPVAADVFNLLQERFGPALTACDVRVEAPRLERVPQTGATKVTATVRVRTSLEALALALDPQRWDDCSRQFFPRAHVAGEKGDVYEPDPETHEVPPVPNPPPGGVSWSKVLFEHFRMEWWLGTSDFKNLLYIVANRTAETYGFTYELERPIWSRIAWRRGPDDEMCGGIQIDEGRLEVVPTRPPSPGWLRVTGVKIVKFSDRNGVPGPILDQWAQVFLVALSGELAHGVCCTPGPLGTAGSGEARTKRRQFSEA